MAHLEIIDGKLAGEQVELSEGSALEIGTKRKAAVRLRDRGVSYVNTVVTLEGSELLVQDHPSTGETSVAGQLLDEGSSIKIGSGTSFKVGPVEIRFLAEAAAGATAAPIPAAAAVDVGELAAMKAELEALRAESGQLAGLKGELEDLRGELGDAEHLASDNIERVNELEQELEGLRAELAEAQGTKAELGSLKQDLEQSQKIQRELEGQLAESKAEPVDPVEAALAEAFAGAVPPPPKHGDIAAVEARLAAGLPSRQNGAGLSAKLRRRESELSRLRSVHAATVSQLAELNTDYQLTIEELDALKP